MKVDISFWKMFGLTGMLANELTQAMKDNKVTAKEALKLIENICDYLDIDLDKEGIEL